MITVMKETIYFINTHKAFTALMLVINLVLNNMIIKKIHLKTNKIISEAKGRRLIENSLYQKCTIAVVKYVEIMKGGMEKPSFTNGEREGLKWQALKVSLQLQNTCLFR